MKILLILFFIALALGQLAAIPLGDYGTVYLHDVFLFFILVSRISLIKKSVTTRPLSKPIIGFAIAASISLLVNINRFTQTELLSSSLYIVRWIFYALMYFIVATGNIDKKYWVRGLYFVGVAIAALGLIQYVLYPDLRNLYYLGWDPHYQRLFSTLLDPNFTGLLLVFTFFLSFIVRTHMKKLQYIACQTITVSALLLTFSRSSYLAFGVGLFVWTMITRKWKIFILTLCIFFGVVLIFPKTGEGQNLTRIASSLARVENWQEGWQLFTQKPLFGHGFNTLRFAGGKLLNVTPQGEEIISRSASGLDNSVLFILATTGIAGLVAYSWLALSAVRRGRDPVYLAILASLGIHSMFTNSLFYPWVMIWIWILLATGDS